MDLDLLLNEICANKFAQLPFWCNGYVKDGIAVLVCCALNGHHSVTTYEWIRDESPINNLFSIVYTDLSGKYKCSMQSSLGINIREFDVIGKLV